MPVSLQSLIGSIKPSRTALLLGAGASVPSGAPSGPALAERLWRKIANKEPLSLDLTETATVLERNFTRRAVISEIVEALKPIQPTGGLLALPTFQWRSVYTTNFDQAFEKAAKQCAIPLAVYRSNYDFSRLEGALNQTKLFKIHGCITQDRSFGETASMILTEGDYAEFSKYREVAFAKLQADLLDGDALIVGQSLNDLHLRRLVLDACAAKDKSGAPGQVHVLVYDEDNLRAPLLEDRGARITFGGIDQLVAALAVVHAAEPKDAEPTEIVQVLPLGVVPTVLELQAEAAKSSNVRRMFHGGAATYADIRCGATFERTRASEVAQNLKAGSKLVLTIVGAAGVGKTTFARQLMSEICATGVSCWEHRSDFPLDHKAWLRAESTLREKNRRGVLLIDECTNTLRQANLLIDELARLESPSLQIILTANAALWSPRIKTPNIFSRGTLVELSRLDDPEIHSLLNLLDRNSEVASMVRGTFRSQPRSQKFSALRQRCAADMFVCLKNIFESDSLDMILLREYNELDEPVQDYYRYVAALESVGARVHRQLVLRLLNLPADRVGSILESLSGIVDESVVSERDGVYAWATRHLVIARKIAEYKFSSLPELISLFEKIIDSANPTVAMELQTLRSICDTETGIGGRIGDLAERRKLYSRITQVAPGERIPWHRLIREDLMAGDLEGADHLIRTAEEAVGSDAPLDRFKVRLLIERADKTVGISRSDRVALLRKAYELALSNIKRHRYDKISYSTVCDVAVRLVERGESIHLLDDAIEKLTVGSELILDPDMVRRISYYQDIRNRRV